MPSTDNEELSRAHDEIRRQAEGLAKAIEDDVRSFRRTAYRQRAWHMTIAAMAVIGSVVGPAMTAVLFTFDWSNPVFQYASVWIVGISAALGAMATLQTVFQWGSKYRHNLRTSIDLEDIHAKLQTSLQTASKYASVVDYIADVAGSIEAASSGRRSVKRNHVLAEMESLPEMPKYVPPTIPAG